MDANQPRIFYMSGGNYFEQVTQLEAKFVKQQPGSVKLTEPSSSRIATAGGVLFWLPTCSVFLLMLLAFRVLDGWKSLQSSTTNCSRYKLTCENCHFFSKNSFLKCAVNPSIVLTEQAIDCSDYITRRRYRKA